ncbi:MAG: PEP-CTERM sorting domain-containing protein [Phycisphaerae bacterium]
MYFGSGTLYSQAIDNGLGLAFSQGYPSAVGWLSHGYGANTPANLSFDGVYALQGASGDIPVSGMLNVTGANGKRADFTATYGLTLPQGVSFTSDSGVFLSVPEPSAFVLLLAGLAGCSRLRRA